jgi:hypothetical protein
MTRTVGRLFVAGLLIIAAIKVFQFQTKVGDNVIGRAKSRDPEQLVIAAALTVGLGLMAVVVGQAFRRVSK